MAVTENFKKMIDEDIESLKDAVSDISNTRTLEYAKLQLYKSVTAKYHPYVPKLYDGLYGYFQNQNTSFYDDVEGDSLHHNLNQVCNKLIAFKATGYPSLIPIKEQRNNSIVLNANYTSRNTNNNENINSICTSFGEVRQQMENMTSLTDTEIVDILNKINELEQIVHSSDRKSKKWENAKGIVNWIADKGVDVGIAMIPLLMQIK